jgi:uncharacterized delta-60 repeat protein
MNSKFACLVLLVISPAFASAQVTRQWAVPYNGPANGVDVATALTVDATGNVYVTGYSDGGATGLDYVILKYNPSGVLQWLVRIDGAANGDDVPVAIVQDANGNIVVTGYSFGGITGYDYLTVSYTPAGTLNWSVTYDGPASSTDFATSMVADAFGNVYVTGGSTGIGSGLDYATIAYDTFGNAIWTSLALPDGAVRYNGSANLDDIANAITIDSAGSLYVTGESTGTGTGLDYATLAYDPLGNPIWAPQDRRYDGAGLNDSAQAIAVDSSSNVYVTGYSVGTTSGPDYATLSYDVFGTQRWVDRYNGPGNATDYANAIVADSIAGQVYVTGGSAGLTSNWDFATLAYSTSAIPAGPIWVARYDGANGPDEAKAIAVDSSGNIYVTGYSYGGATNLDYATLSYTSGGGQRWVARYDAATLDDVPYALAVDPAGSVYVTGYGTNAASATSGQDFVTLKYTQP